MTTKKRSGPSKLELYRAEVDAVIREIQGTVSAHGLAKVQAAVNRLKAKEKLLRQLRKLKQQVNELEKETDQ